MLKIRNLGKYGVVTDVDPYDLPPEAWSFGKNVRFRGGRVERAPVFRSVLTIDADPRFCSSALPTSGLDLLVIGYKNGRVKRFESDAQTDLSISGYVNADAELPFTTTHLADVFYINRGDRIPWYKRSSDTIFQALGGGWNANWRAKLLRSCGNALVALNVTKSGTSFPTMIKTSALPTSGTIPSSWDETVPSTLATENILAEMEGAIIDAQNLGNNLYIYGLNEAWVMSPGGSGVFDYQVTPFGKGSINANCAITVGGRQYVFGVNDIWMHDGVSHQSVCDEKTRQFIFSTININRANRCFVAHFPQRNELHFCYVAGDQYTDFVGTAGNGCNRAAIFNYAESHWTFDDLPYAFSACLANLDNALTYAIAPGTYDTGGSFLDQEDSIKRTLAFVGESNATYGLSNKLYAFDQYGAGSSVAYSVDTAATKGAYLERTGIDLDELPEKELRGYVVVTSIYPQARLGTEAAALKFAFGSADAPNLSPSWSEYQTYNGNDEIKLDYMSAGRWLAIKAKHEDYREMSFSGVDLDYVLTGER